MARARARYGARTEREFAETRTILRGSDYPHDEGTFPYTREALRFTYAGMPREGVAVALGGNAGRVFARGRRCGCGDA